MKKENKSLSKFTFSPDLFERLEYEEMVQVKGGHKRVIEVNTGRNCKCSYSGNCVTGCGGSIS